MAKFLRLVNGVPRMVEETGTVSIYQETTTLVSNVTTGTPITLPNSGSYTSDELEVRLDGVRMTAGIDYNFVGSPPRTQIEFTFDLLIGDQLSFRVDRSA